MDYDSFSKKNIMSQYLPFLDQNGGDFSDEPQVNPDGFFNDLTSQVFLI